MIITFKRTLMAIALTIAVGTTLTASASAAPQITIQTERANHPNLARASDALLAAINDLERAPDDFDGHKQQAINDCKAARRSIKAAIYYRLKLDDATLDRAP